MTLNDRRRALMAANGNVVEMICGTATSGEGTLTIPVPEGYYYHVYNVSRTFADKDVQFYLCTANGMFISKHTVSPYYAERLNADPFGTHTFLTRTATDVTWRGAAANTSGLIYDGDEWFYIAWKEEE